ncbi:MAG: hypothetical protein RLZ53_841 [Actinomycetota bacterium]|jgi:hypothetical protein
MSELKAIVDGLRGLDVSERRSLIAGRLINLSGIDDLYALADALNTPKSFAALIGSLSHHQLDALAKIARGDEVDQDIVAKLRGQLLVYLDGSKVKIFDALHTTLREVRAFTRPIPVIPEPAQAPAPAAVDRQAGITVFQTIQALTEVIFDLEKHLVREVGKGNVGLPDVKRLAAALGCTNDQAKGYFGLAAALGLTVIHDGRHRLTAKSVAWLDGEATARIETLLHHYRDVLGGELIASLSALEEATYLPVWFQTNYPFAENRPASRMGKILGLAEDLGLAAQGWTTSWFGRLLAQNSKAMTEAVSHLPGIQERIILQADGSIIAPGPLATKVEARLRKIAETESIGLASTYRLTPLSITHGLELGERVSGIREMLTQLTAVALPQPIEYLLTDVERRFGKLVIGPGNLEWRSQISSQDAVLLTEISSDSRLKPFALHRQAPELLACRFEPSVVYFGLRECGFLAIRVDVSGQVISPITTVEPMAVGIAESPIDAKVAEIFAEDQKLNSLDSDEVMIRQIQLAIRNKALLSLKVKVADGSLADFELMPSGIANGRVRGKDRKAQIERTLPLASIVSIDLA